VLSDTAIFSYKCDNYYHKASESGIIYNDPTLSIDWKLPSNQLKLSKKDLDLPQFKSLMS
jgi:dTDP-4-dehydrorhamnose 3,5-epimerase